MSCTICGSAHGHFRIKLSRRSTPTTSWSICPIQWVRWKRSTESRSREPIFSWACLTGTHSKRGETQPSYYRKLWIRCGNEKGGVPFRVGNANPGGSRVEGDATDVEGSREWSWKGSRRAAF